MGLVTFQASVAISQGVGGLGRFVLEVEAGGDTGGPALLVENLAFVIARFERRLQADIGIHFARLRCENISLQCQARSTFGSS